MEGVQEQCRILLPAWCPHPCCRAVASLQPSGNDRSFFWAAGGGVRTPMMGTTLSCWCHGWHLALQLQRRRRAQHGHNQKVLGCSLHPPRDRSMVTSPSQTKKKKIKEKCRLQTLLIKGVWQSQQGFPAFITTATLIASRGPGKAGIPRCLALGRLAGGISAQEVTGGEEPGEKISALGTRSGA